MQKLFLRLAWCLSVYLLFCFVFNLSRQGLPQLNEIYSFPVLENFVSFCNWNTVIFRTVWLGHLIDFSLTVSVNRSTSACFTYTYTHIAHLTTNLSPSQLVIVHLRLCSVMCDALQPVALWQTVAHQAPLSMGFSRKEYWSGLPFPDPGIEPTFPVSPALQADSLLLSSCGSPLVIVLTFKSAHLQLLANQRGHERRALLLVSGNQWATWH